MSKVKMTKYKLKDVAIIYDGPHATPKRTEHGPIYLGIDAITENCKLNPQEYTFLSEQDYKIWTKRVIPQHKDIVFSYEATLGRYAIIPEGFIGCLGRRLGIVRITSDKIFHSWLYYYFQSPEWKAYIANRIVKGSTVNRISVEDMPEYVIQAPSLPIQRKIAAVLTALDDKIALNKRINEKLEAMAKRLYDYWFVQFDFPDKNGRPYKSSGGKMVWNETLKREIPAGWEVKRIDDYCRIFTGKKDVNQSLDKGKYKFFSCAPDYRYSNEMLFDGKAIIISGNGSYTGRTIFVNCAFDLYQRTYAVVQSFNSDNNLEYIYCSVKKFLHTKVSGGTHGSAIPYIVYNDIAKEMLAYSSCIVAKFQKIIIPVLEKIVNLETEISRLTALRDRLLPLLMNGQVVVEGES